LCPHRHPCGLPPPPKGKDLDGQGGQPVVPLRLCASASPRETSGALQSHSVLVVRQAPPPSSLRAATSPKRGGLWLCLHRHPSGLPPPPKGEDLDGQGGQPSRTSAPLRLCASASPRLCVKHLAHPIGKSMHGRIDPTPSPSLKRRGYLRAK
jgi:hypothetical protein